MGHHRGKVNYRLREENVRLRNEYIHAMMAVNSDENSRVVYLDESYCHHHYQCFDNSIYNPNDKQDLHTKGIHMGRQYCFIAAIIDAIHTTNQNNNNGNNGTYLLEENGERPGNVEFLKETLDVFEGGSRSNKKETVNHHGMFDLLYIETWFAKLLTILANKGVTNATIIMDNAKYHKKMPNNAPNNTCMAIVSAGGSDTILCSIIGSIR